MTQLDDDRFIPGLRQLVDAVHAEGAKIVPQLYQAGRYAHSAMTGQPSVAPSPIPSRLTGQTPVELTVEKTVSYTHLRAHETRHDLVCRLLLEKKKKNK